MEPGPAPCARGISYLPFAHEAQREEFTCQGHSLQVAQVAYELCHFLTPLGDQGISSSLGLVHDKLAGEGLEGLVSVPSQRHILFPGPPVESGQGELVLRLFVSGLFVPPSSCNFHSHALTLCLHPSVHLCVSVSFSLSPCFFYLHLPLPLSSLLPVSVSLPFISSFIQQTCIKPCARLFF